MAQGTNSTFIWQMRFRLQEGQLKEQRVYLLPFPQEAVDEIENTVRTHLRKDKLEFKQRLHTATLSRVIRSLALAPYLVSAYDSRGGHPREIILLTEKGQSAQDILQPYMLKEIFRTWISRWLKRSFSNELSSEEIETFVNDFMNRLGDLPERWEVRDLYNLWTAPERGLQYAVIPSLLAVLLAGSSMLIEDQEVIWRLAQENTGLYLLSKPIMGQHGMFAYKLSFSVTTDAGSKMLSSADQVHLGGSNHTLPTPWIHTSLSVQRYATINDVDDTMGLNWQRGATLLVGRVDRARHPVWGIPNSTLVPVEIKEGTQNRLYIYDDDLVAFLQALGAEFQIDMERLARQPQVYWGGDNSESDEAYLVFSEGMQPNHGMETGLSMQARYDLMIGLIDYLNLWLIPDKPLPQDKETFRVSQPLTLQSFREIDSRKIVKKRAGETDETYGLRLDAARYTMKIQAIQRALNLTKGQRITLLVAYYQEGKDNLMEKVPVYLRQMFSMPEGTTHDPEILDLRFVKIPDELYIGLDETKWDGKNETQKAKIKQQLLLERQDAYRKWLLAQMKNSPNGNFFALIELPSELIRGKARERNYHGAVRGACLNSRIRSQMIHPRKVKEKEGTFKNRVEQALTDLLIRQTGAVFADSEYPPALVYQLAGLDPNLAQNLSAIALYRLRKNNPRFEYIVAVRWLPDGCLQMRYEDDEGIWQPYHEGVFALARAMLEKHELIRNTPYNQREDSNVAAFRAAREFVLSLIDENPEQPTLLLVEATQWRGGNDKMKIWPHLHNEYLEQDIFSFDSNGQYDREAYPKLYVVRLRDTSDQREKATYVLLDGENWETSSVKPNFSSVAGFVDTSTDSSLLHYGIIGGQPATTSKDQKYQPNAPKWGDGGDTAYKHPRMIEAIPFFGQADMDLLFWARLVGFLCFSPGWAQGNTVRPFMMHMAYQAVKDILDALGLSIEESD
jgi:DNA-binding MarR family transcriptional regulator